MKYLLTLLIPIALISCKAMEANDIKQGVKGQVLWFEGNLMPGPGQPEPKGKPVERTVAIYELTNMSDLTGDIPLYQSIGTKKVAEVTSDKDGNFSVTLEPGEYSVFTNEEGGYFANSFDGKNNVAAITVTADQVTALTIKVNYAATY